MKFAETMGIRLAAGAMAVNESREPSDDEAAGRRGQVQNLPFGMHI
jgi:hypothetical protein